MITSVKVLMIRTFPTVISLWSVQAVAAVCSWTWGHIPMLPELCASSQVIITAVVLSVYQSHFRWWCFFMAHLPQVLIQVCLGLACMGIIPAADPLIVLAQFTSAAHWPWSHYFNVAIILELPSYLWATSLGCLLIIAHIGLWLLGTERSAVGKPSAA